MTQRKKPKAIHQPAQGHEVPIESHCSINSDEPPHDTHGALPYHKAVHMSHQAIQMSQSRSKFHAEPGAQPLEPTHHGAIHWTPSKCNSKIFERPTESSGDSNSKNLELHCEPTEPPHELPSAPYRVRPEYINVPALKSVKLEIRKMLHSPGNSGGGTWGCSVCCATRNSWGMNRPVHAHSLS